MTKYKISYQQQSTTKYGWRKGLYEFRTLFRTFSSHNTRKEFYAELKRQRGVSDIRLWNEE